MFLSMMEKMRGGGGETTEKEKRRQLDDTARRLEERINDKYYDELIESSLRNAEPVLLSDEQAKEWGAYRHGRVQRENNELTYHFAPKMTDRKAKWKPMSKPSVSAAELLRDKGTFTFSWSGEIPTNVETKESYKSIAYRYEQVLLRELARRQDTIWLSNPALTTVYAAEGMNFKISCNPKYRGMYREALHAFGKGEETYGDPEPWEWVYCGSNGMPKWRYDRSIALLPNFQREQGLDSFYLEENKTGVKLYYTKAGRQIQVDVPFVPQYLRYGPKELDGFLGRTEREYFLESTEEFNIPKIHEETQPIFYLGGSFNGQLEDEKWVYDIRGEGTYLSRRYLAREYAYERGKKLAPLLKEGSIPISWTTTLLQESMWRYQPGMLSTISVRSMGKVAVGEVVWVYSQTKGQLSSIPGIYISEAVWDGKTLDTSTVGPKVVVRRREQFDYNQPRVMEFFFGAGLVTGQGYHLLKGPVVQEKTVFEAVTRLKVELVTESHPMSEYAKKYAVSSTAMYADLSTDPEISFVTRVRENGSESDPYEDRETPISKKIPILWRNKTDIGERLDVILSSEAKVSITEYEGREVWRWNLPAAVWTGKDGRWWASRIVRGCEVPFE